MKKEQETLRWSPVPLFLNDRLRSILSCGVLENLTNVLDVETTIDVLADHDNGSKTAGTHATQAVERELAVGGSLAYLNTQDALDLLKQTLGTAHVASGTQAD